MQLELPYRHLERPIQTGLVAELVVLISAVSTLYTVGFTVKYTGIDSDTAGVYAPNSIACLEKVLIVPECMR